MANDEYKSTGPTRTYIIENVMRTVGSKVTYRYAAYRQDKEGFEDRAERCLGFAQTIGELAIYVAMHYPGSTCVGVFPPGDCDESELSHEILQSLGLPINGQTD